MLWASSHQDLRCRHCGRQNPERQVKTVALCGFGGADGEVELLAQAQNRDLDRLAGGPFGQEAVDVVHRGHVAIVHPDQKVAGLQAGLVGGAARGHFEQDDRLLGGQVQGPDGAAAQRTGHARDAQEAANDPAFGHQARQDPTGGARGDREADALGGGDDRGVDADHLAAGVDERAAGVAGVERGRCAG